MGKRPFKIQKNGVPAKIVADIENREKLKVKEYAQKYNVTESYIRTTINYLRKRGYWWIGIVGYEPGIGNKAQAGRIVDLREKEEWVDENNERLWKDKYDRLHRQWKLIEGAWTMFPEKRLELEEGVWSVVNKLREYHRQLLQSPKKYEHTENTTE